MDIDGWILTDEVNVASSGIHRMSRRDVVSLSKDQIQRLEAAVKGADIKHRAYTGVLVEPAFDVRPQSFLCK